MITHKSALRFEVLARVCADLIILNGGLLAGLTVKHVLLRLTGYPEKTILGPYVHGFWALSMIGVVFFYGMGFYTKGRAYMGRYKALVVVQTTILVYLVFGFAGFVLPHVARVGRPALVLSWTITTLMLLCARLWAIIWRRVMAIEGHPAAASHLAVTSSANRNMVLLIGGAGYIGSGLLPKLLNGGYQVRLLDAFLYGREPIAPWASHPNLDIVKGDFRRVDVVVRAMRSVNTVIHLGAIVGDPACALDEELTIETNLLATRMIAEVTKGQGIERFIFASTCSVYGASDQYLDERSSLNPVSLYARSKIACENMLLTMKSDSFCPVILRFGTIYGLSGRTRFDLVVNLLSAKAVVDGVITVYGGSQWRPFLHVNDAALAVYLACGAPRQALQETIFNVGSDEQNCTLGDLGRQIWKMVPAAELQFFEENVDRRNYRVNFNRIRKSLGFRPEWTLTMGVQQVLDAISQGQVVDYKDPRYSNVRFLSEEIGLESLRFNQQRWVHEVLPTDRAGQVPVSAA